MNGQRNSRGLPVWISQNGHCNSGGDDTSAAAVQQYGALPPPCHQPPLPRDGGVSDLNSGNLILLCDPCDFFLLATTHAACYFLLFSYVLRFCGYLTTNCSISNTWELVLTMIFTRVDEQVVPTLPFCVHHRSFVSYIFFLLTLGSLMLTIFPLIRSSLQIFE